LTAAGHPGSGICTLSQGSWLSDVESNPLKRQKPKDAIFRGRRDEVRFKRQLKICKRPRHPAADYKEAEESWDRAREQAKVIFTRLIGKIN
jgi:hypothetical protein